MSRQIKKMVIAILMIAIMFNFIVEKAQAATTTVEPADNQYLELRAVEVNQLADGTKQLIMELWGYNVEFKGFDVRFSYDSSKVTPSNLTTNKETTDESEYFKFEDEFSSALDMFTLPDGDETLRMVVSFDPPVNESEHIIEKENIGKVVNTDDGVLLAKMSFKMTADVFDVSWFNLVTSTSSSPKTGIKINVNGSDCFEAQSTFIFTDQTASRDAYLSNFVVSTGEVDEDVPENSTYKEYTLTPTFDKEIFNYELELFEYLDTLDIKAVQNDTKSSMKIKVPKRDENGNLVYDTGGTNIIYEEKELKDNELAQITLNKLGEPDTQITIIVTAEDTTTTNSYNLTIKRPYGTIKGKVILADFDDEEVVSNMLDVYGIELNNQAQINIYKAGLVEWEAITDIYGITYSDPLTYDDIEDIPKEATMQTELDGTFEIYVIPGTLDIQVTRLAYLDYIYSDVIINAGDIIDMETFRLKAGDANRDGVISQEDINMVKKLMDVESTDPEFSEACNPTQLGTIIAEDLAYSKQNQDEELQIKYF